MLMAKSLPPRQRRLALTAPTFPLATPVQSCPDLPIILYISNSGALVERMAACQPGAPS